MEFLVQNINNEDLNYLVLDIKQFIFQDYMEKLGGNLDFSEKYLMFKIN